MKRSDILLSEVDRIGLDVGEAHGAPELLRHLQAGAGPLGHLGQRETGGLSQQQVLVSRQRGPLRGVRPDSGLTFHTLGTRVSLLLDALPDPG